MCVVHGEDPNVRSQALYFLSGANYYRTQVLMLVEAEAGRGTGEVAVWEQWQSLDEVRVAGASSGMFSERVEQLIIGCLGEEVVSVLRTMTGEKGMIVLSGHQALMEGRGREGCEALLRR